MTTTMRVSMLASVALLAMAAGTPVQAQANSMTFFVTSNGPGKGGDLGGLAGADAHCGKLAQAAGSTGKTWHAYLSTQGTGAVNARDRIGKGPWQNAKGVVVAKSVDDLHSDNNKLTKQNNLSEKGEVINGRSEKPNRHDILTGSTADGRAFPAGEDRTCNNWTSSTSGAAMLGHHDRLFHLGGGRKSKICVLRQRALEKGAPRAESRSTLIDGHRVMGENHG